MSSLKCFFYCTIHIAFLRCRSQTLEWHQERGVGGDGRGIKWGDSMVSTCCSGPLHFHLQHYKHGRVGMIPVWIWSLSRELGTQQEFSLDETSVYPTSISGHRHSHAYLHSGGIYRRSSSYQIVFGRWEWNQRTRRKPTWKWEKCEVPTPFLRKTFRGILVQVLLQICKNTWGLNRDWIEPNNAEMSFFFLGRPIRHIKIFSQRTLSAILLNKCKKFIWTCFWKTNMWSMLMY